MMNKAGLTWIIVIGFTMSVSATYVNTLDISRDVVFRRNGTISILCGYNWDSYSMPDVDFVWRHYNTVKIEEGPNYRDDKMEETLYNKYKIEHGGPGDSGIYSCEILGQPEVVSTLVTEVTVDEGPVVGVKDDKVKMALVKSPSEGIQCFETQPSFSEVPNCMLQVKVTESAAKSHEVVIVSSSAMMHYGTIQNAMDNFVTFNVSKPLIVLSKTQKGHNTSFTLFGDEVIVAALQLTCSREPETIPMDIYELESATSSKRIFVCEGNTTELPFTVKVFQNGQELFSERVTKEDISGAGRITASLLIGISVLWHWL